MVAPVVLVSVGGLFANGLLGADSATSNRLHELNIDRLSILRGPRGEILSEDQLPDLDRARLQAIDHQIPQVMARIQGIRDSCVLVYAAMGLLVFSVILIAAAIPGRSVALAYTALALVVSGVLFQFAAIIVATKVMRRSVDTLAYETRHTSELR